MNAKEILADFDPVVARQASAALMQAKQLCTRWRPSPLAEYIGRPAPPPDIFQATLEKVRAEWLHGLTFLYLDEVNDGVRTLAYECPFCRLSVKTKFAVPQDEAEKGRLEELYGLLNVVKVDFNERGDRLRKDDPASFAVDAFAAELVNIFSARPQTWPDQPADADFVTWAQSRARHVFNQWAVFMTYESEATRACRKAGLTLPALTGDALNDLIEAARVTVNISATLPAEVPDDGIDAVAFVGNLRHALALLAEAVGKITGRPDFAAGGFCEGPSMFLLQLRNTGGNYATFWATGGGYTPAIDRAKVFAEEEADATIKAAEGSHDFVKWPVALAETYAERVIDVHTLERLALERRSK